MLFRPITEDALLGLSHLRWPESKHLGLEEELGREALAPEEAAGGVAGVGAEPAVGW